MRTSELMKCGLSGMVVDASGVVWGLVLLAAARPLIRFIAVTCLGRGVSGGCGFIICGAAGEGTSRSPNKGLFKLLT